VFDPKSRYASIEETQLTVSDGKEERTLRYKKRRFIPEQQGQVLLTEHLVKQGERLDVVTTLYLGDPTQFWRVCDANGVFDPNELTDEVGRRIRVVMPAI
jgi:hypothetical protein